MNRKIFLFLLSILSFTALKAQNILLANYLNTEIDSVIKNSVLQSLDTLFAQIDRNTLTAELVGKDNSELNISIFNSLKGTEYNQKDSINNFYKKQLINAYPISSNQYFISIAYIGSKANEMPVLKRIFNLVAKTENGKWAFSIPLYNLTSAWKTKVMGNITYHFNDKINIERAVLFDKKNSTIAEKLGLNPEKFNFYLCNNYQDILPLLGYGYDAESNGQTRDGYGVEANTIFSIMHNEDFSHDVFHYYSEKIRTNKRNRTVEEGMAYYWGNAYYTNQHGEIINQRELVLLLKKYVKENPQNSLIDLFNNNSKIFNKLAKEPSAKSVMSGLICDKIEKTKGIKGIKFLLNCGSGDDNYFKCIDELLQINKGNFDKEVMKLIEEYK